MPYQVLTTGAVPSLFWQLPPIIQTWITVCMTIGIFAKLALQKMLEVVVPATNVTWFFIRVFVFLIHTRILNLNLLPIAHNLVELCTTVGTSIRKLCSLLDTTQAKQVLAWQKTLLSFFLLVKICETNWTLLSLNMTVFFVLKFYSVGVGSHLSQPFVTLFLFGFHSDYAWLRAFVFFLWVVGVQMTKLYLGLFLNA